MKIVTPKQMNEIDRKTIEELGIPGIVLMENAAIRVFEKIKEVFSSKQEGLNDKSVVVVAGKGNNGGDAYAVARHLYNNNVKIKVFLTTAINNITGDAKINLDIIKNMDIEIIDDYDIKDFEENIKGADFVVDGIFGTGLNADVKGIYFDIIKIINEAKKIVFSIDIPSGINGNNGKVMGIAVKADYTVTFGFLKIGLVLNEGRNYAGRIEVVDISIDKKFIDIGKIKSELVDNALVKDFLPMRYNESNKGTYGRVIIVTGSKGMVGSGGLAANACYRMGTGLVYLAVPESIANTYSILCPEAVVMPVKDNKNGHWAKLDKEEYELLADKINSMDVLCIGPGMQMSDGAKKIVKKLVTTIKKPVVIDADALNIIAEDLKVLKKIKNCVITPHPGEMAKLMNLTAKEVQADRINIATSFAKKWDVTVVLKGYNTIIATSDGKIYINGTGNNGMATAGSGDVLAGIIAAIIGQKKNIIEAAILGVYLHGLAGDIAANQLNEYSIKASDIIGNLPAAINQLRLCNY